MKVVNKRALRDFEVLETFEAGIVLNGGEVKSVKQGSVNFAASRVVIGSMEEGREGIWLVGMLISPYKNAPQADYDSTRSRKLLLKREQIEYLATKMKIKGLTAVPLSCYTTRDLIKIEIALVRGKKQFEKREEEKKREVEKNIRQVVKNQGK